MEQPEAQELARQRALSRYTRSQDASREVLNRVAQLAAQFIGVPGAQVNLMGESSQSTVAHFDWPSAELPREDSFCARTILLSPGEEVLEVPDTRLDARFQTNPLVLGPPSLRYYAGAPLYTPDGYAIGALCVLDTVPHPALTPLQRGMLARLADLVVVELERQRAVSELREVYEERREQELRFRALLEHTSDLVVIKDRESRYLDINPSAEKMLGLRGDVLGKTDQELFGDGAYQGSREEDVQVMATRGQLRYETQVSLGGVNRLFEANKFPLYLPGGEVGGVIAVARDLTERDVLETALREANTVLERRVQERTQALETLAYRDPLTLLSNRRAFDLALDTAVSRAAGGKGEFHLLVFDLDDLKGMNDRFGHARGDELLKAFASGLSRAFEGGAVFRFGGDEFAVLLEGEPPDAPPNLVAQAVELTRAAGFERADASAGFASYPQDAGSARDLLRLADQRMLRDKAGRRAEWNLVGPLEPSLVVPTGAGLQAIRSTLHLLTQEGELDAAAWKGLLEAAVVSIPGAEAGSLVIREDDEFVYRAQVGFSDALLGMRLPLSEAQDWHGQEGWHRGSARLIASTAVLEEHSRATVVRPEQHALYWRHGALQHLRANISVPVMVGREVGAVLNLDNLRHENAFEGTALRIAEEFAVQAGALLAAARRRAAEAARRRELEVLVEMSAALSGALTLEAVEATLCREAGALLGTDHVVYLRPALDRDAPGFVIGGAGPGSSALLSSIPAAAFQPAREALALREPLQVPGSPLASGLFGLPRAPLMFLPLCAGDTPAGVLVIARERRAVSRAGEGKGFSELETRLLEAVASQGATAVQRVWAEREKSKRAAELELLAEMGRLAGLLDSPEEVVEMCLQSCRIFLGADYAGYVHIEQGVLLHYGEAPPAFHEAFATLTLDPQTLGRSLEAAEPLIVTASYSSRPTASPLLSGAGVKGMVMVPVVVRGKRVGLVAFLWFRPVSVLPSFAAPLAARLGELIGRALERQYNIQELKATHEGALLTLGLSLEMRDFETHGHTERVVALSAEFGQRLNLSPDELEGLRQGAYLHDVGKLAIPDSVLLKPGKLDAGEWRLMQLHAQVGAEMVARIPSAHPVALALIRHHHERWDGQGYPDGLSGEAIPLAARIFSLVDVYDALISVRPYKRAWTPEEARQEIGRQAGAQFDPALVEMFLDVLAARTPEAGDFPPA